MHDISKDENFRFLSLLKPIKSSQPKIFSGTLLHHSHDLTLITWFEMWSDCYGTILYADETMN